MVITVVIYNGRQLKFNHVSRESVAVMMEIEDWYSDTMKQQACFYLK
jgi:hypothetical protein